MAMLGARLFANNEEKQYTSIVTLDDDLSVGNARVSKDSAEIGFGALIEIVPFEEPMVIKGLIAIPVFERRDEKATGSQ